MILNIVFLVLGPVTKMMQYSSKAVLAQATIYVVKVGKEILEFYHVSQKVGLFSFSTGFFICSAITKLSNDFFEQNMKFINNFDNDKIPNVIIQSRVVPWPN